MITRESVREAWREFLLYRDRPNRNRLMEKALRQIRVPIGGLEMICKRMFGRSRSRALALCLAAALVAGCGGGGSAPPRPPAANQAPAVSAGVDLAIALSASASLDGTVTDDGLPNPPAAVATTWTQVSGPGTVTFGDASAVDTTASFSAVGSYVLRLAAADGELQASDDVTVTVTVGNQAPVVDAGANEAISLPDSASLKGTVTDDGLPNPPAAVTTTWTQVSGPGTVTFGDASAVDTTASFSAVGSYILRLTADDGELQASDAVTVNVGVGVQGDVDLVVSSVSGSAASVENGETLTVTVTVANSLAGAAGEFATGLFLSTDDTIDPADDTYLGRFDLQRLFGGGSVTRVLDVRVPGGLAPGAYYLGAYADCTLAAVETDESNNGLAAAAIDVSAPLDLPDLVVTDFTAPDAIRGGETIELVATVANMGSPGSAGPFRVGFYLSDDATIDPATDTFLIGRDVPGLDGGDEAELTASVELPGGLAWGDYFLGVFADDLLQVPEDDEANNTAARAASATPALADLKPASSSPNGPSSGTPGETITTSASVVNFGEVDAPASRAALYLSDDRLFDLSDLLIGEADVEPLNDYGFGDSDGVTFDWTAPGTSGTYYLFVVVDSDNDVTESNEENNVGGPSTFTVVPVTPPDLSPSLPNVYPGTAYLPGSGINVLVTIQNRGTTPVADGSYRVGFYLSTDQEITTADTLLGTWRGSRSVAISAAIPAGTDPGQYYVGIIADDLSEVTESDESNNVTAGVLILVLDAGKAELEIRAFTLYELAFSPGATISPYTWIDNTGIISSGSFQVDYYLSADAFIDPAADTLIGTWSPASIDPADYAQGTQTLTVPVGTPLGTYYLGLVADSQGQVDEENEDNNTALATGVGSGGPVVEIEIVEEDFSGPTDLVGSIGSSVDPDMVAGGQAVLWARVRNLGSATSTAFRAGVYLSENPTITTVDTLVGTVTYGSGIGAGETDDEYAYLTIPADTAPGLYYIGVVADDTGVIDEADEGNNGESPSPHVVSIASGPADLVAANVGSTRWFPGAYAELSADIWNTGGLSSGGFRVSFYLSTDETIDPAADTLLGTALVGTVSPQDALPAEAIAVLPPGLPAGTSYLGAIADDQDAVAEADEANNVGVREMTVPALPDLYPYALGGARSGLPDQVLPTGFFGLFVWVMNQGAPVSSGSYRIGYYLSSDPVITTADTLIGWTRTGATGQEVRIPAGTAPGQYHLGVILDDLGEVAEADETNNAVSRPFVVAGGPTPDLVIGEIALDSAAPALKPGVPYQMSVETVNLGGAFSATSVTGIYVSTDEEITTDDTFLTAQAAMALSWGGATYSYDNDVTVVLPAGLPAGTYYIGAIADRDGAITELSEANNTASLAVEVTDADRTDLAAESLSFSGELYRGFTSGGTGMPHYIRTPWARLTLSNQGTTTQTARMSLYISADQTLSADDLHCSTTSVDLVPGERRVRHLTVNVPVNMPLGSYYLLAVIDDLAEIDEDDETNNIAVSGQVEIR